MEIRAARPDDAPTIARLLEALGYRQTVPEVQARLDEWLARDDSSVLVADAEGDVAGVVAVHACPYFERSGSWARIAALVVDEPHRRRGVGRRLVEAVHAEARALGCSDVEVTSRRTRMAAHALYRAAGYAEISERSGRFVRSITPGGKWSEALAPGDGRR